MAAIVQGPSLSQAAPAEGLGPRLIVGLTGVLLAALIAGLNNRVPGLALPDLRGALGLAQDDASWLTTGYSAGELAVMPFATWFAVTCSLRRTLLACLTLNLVLAGALPLIQDLHLMVGLRALQGFASGALIPLLMMSALRFLPPQVRLHGLALFALTATFAPNVSLWVCTFALDHLQHWQWVYWHVIPPGVLALGLIWWGMPKAPALPQRWRQGNWLGMALGLPGLALLVVGLDQGVRLEWTQSPLVLSSLVIGSIFTVIFLISEWLHPAPFMRLQLLARRNLTIAFSVFVLLLIVTTGGVGLPTNLLGQVQGLRVEQVASLGLLVGLPQLLLGPAVALLLYRRWIDARVVMAAGLASIAFGCWLGAKVDSSWLTQEFYLPALFQMAGQPMAIVSLLFLATSVVQPAEGPFVAGIVNTLRALGTVLSTAFTAQGMQARSTFYSDMLLDHATQAFCGRAPDLTSLGTFAGAIAQQAAVLAASDLLRIFALIAICLGPMALCMRYIAPPARTARAPQPSAAGPNGPNAPHASGDQDEPR
ncbi:MFS transporter, DHA2 family, multidrug resistance protein [Pseudoxanthomonas sp. GM95]|uniref:MFS transporter n=1 Tax=Pseudoxanthomonas sp. GM95 TaxID=1881043 RepID=UPI0008C64C2D|nr:MFS transporter [Pseudoxanthomonas sp. GM95]SEL11905.1 MFS transporter, DHA2 family, multidrug resistance protein [Pseudoxanthomonas sp. GM95]